MNACAICGNYSEMPLVLLCCWKVICSSHSIQNKPQNNSHCPICSKPLQILPNLLVKCQRCESEPISIICKSCSAYLCSICNQSIHDKGKFKSHERVQSKLSYSSLCATHNHPYDFYCNLCKLCCSLCKCTHQKIKINEFSASMHAEYQVYANRISAKLNECNKSFNAYCGRYEEFMDSVGRLIFELNSGFVKIQTMLKAKHDELLQVINEMKEKFSKGFDKANAEFSKNREKLKLALLALNSSETPISALLMIPKESIDNLIATEHDFDQVPISLPFKLNLSTIESYIETASIIEKDSHGMVFKSPKHTTHSRIGTPHSLESTPRSISKDNSHKRLDSSHLQDLPPRPSSILAKHSQSIIRHSKTQSKPIASNNSEESEPELLEKRTFIKNFQSFNAIKLSWTHISNPSLEYLLECSLDGMEFRQVYRGKLRTCIITELLQNTQYVFRVAAAISETIGEFSDLLVTSTYATQEIDAKCIGGFATYDKGMIEFKGNGLIYSLYPYSFGKFYWEVNIVSITQVSGFVKIGVTGNEKKSVIGRSVLYGKSEIVVRVILDVDAGFLVFFDCNMKEEDVIKLPQDNVFFAAVQYKSNKHAPKGLKVYIKFDCENFTVLE